MLTLFIQFYFEKDTEYYTVQNKITLELWKLLFLKCKTQIKIIKFKWKSTAITKNIFLLIFFLIGNSKLSKI